MDHYHVLTALDIDDIADCLKRHKVSVNCYTGNYIAKAGVCRGKVGPVNTGLLNKVEIGY